MRGTLRSRIGGFAAMIQMKQSHTAVKLGGQGRGFPHSMANAGAKRDIKHRKRENGDPWP
jgi:hypothetical protein